MKNYVHYSQYDTPLHSEILVQLVENGLIGFILFLLLIYALSKSILKSKLKPYVKNFFLIILVLHISLLFGTWQYNNVKMWIPLILIIKLTQLKHILHK